MKKKSRMLMLSVISAMLMMACICPGSNFVQQIFDQQMDELESQVAEQLEESIGAIPEAIGESGMEELLNQGVPENIPMAEDYEDLFSLGSTINYSTAADVESMKAFYREQMPAYGWTQDEDLATTDLGPNASVLNFHNDDETVMITLVEWEANTKVTIIITQK